MQSAEHEKCNDMKALRCSDSHTHTHTHLGPTARRYAAGCRCKLQKLTRALNGTVITLDHITHTPSSTYHITSYHLAFSWQTWQWQLADGSELSWRQTIMIWWLRYNRVCVFAMYTSLFFLLIAYLVLILYYQTNTSSFTLIIRFNYKPFLVSEQG